MLLGTCLQEKQEGWIGKQVVPDRLSTAKSAFIALALTVV